MSNDNFFDFGFTVVDEGELELLKTTEDRRGIVSPTG